MKILQLKCKKATLHIRKQQSQVSNQIKTKADMYQEYSKQKMIFLFQNFSLKIETNSTFLVLNVDADKTTKRQKHNTFLSSIQIIFMV